MVGKYVMDSLIKLGDVYRLLPGIEVENALEKVVHKPDWGPHLAMY